MINIGVLFIAVKHYGSSIIIRQRLLRSLGSFHLRVDRGWLVDMENH